MARRGHSEKCRKRIEEKMKLDEEGKKKIEKTESRTRLPRTWKSRE